MELKSALQAGIIVCDGAMGTELQRRGLGRGVTPDSWNITHPEKVKDVHKAYIQAGAQAILTNTFGANSMRVPEDGEYTVQQLNEAGVKNARDCAGQDVLVFGDIGPSGREDQLPPYGTQPEQTFYDAFKEQAVALAEAEVDAIMVGTMSSLAEAILAVRAARENADLPVICTERPLEEVHLTLVEQGLDVPVLDEGRFTIGRLRAGDYTLEIAFDGGKPKRHQISVPAPDYEIEA